MAPFLLRLCALLAMLLEVIAHLVDGHFTAMAWVTLAAVAAVALAGLLDHRP